MKLHGHLLHQSLHHVDVCHLIVGEIFLDFGEVVFWEALVGWVVGSLRLMHMLVNAISVAVHAEPKHVVDTRDVFLDVVKVLHLLKLLER